MIWLRRGFVFLLSVVLFVSLVGGVASLNINHNLANPSHLESWLADSKIYDHVVSSALKQAEKTSPDSGNSGSVSLNDPIVRQAAETAFSPALVQQTVNTFINSNYDWLKGKTPTPDFKIDLTTAKQNFAKQVGQAAQAHLAALPICSAQQLAQLSIPVDVLSITCRPATLDPKAEAAQVAQEVNDNGDFLSSPVITATTLNQDTSSNQDSNSDGPSQPYYKQASWAPKAYQVGEKLPWIFGLLALLSGAGIVFSSVSRRRGARRIGVVLALAGLVLIGVKVLADASVNKFASISVKGSLASDLKQPISDFMRKLEPQLVQNYLWFGIAFVVAAAVIFIVLFRSRNGTNKRPPGKPPQTGGTGPPTDTSNIRLSRRRPSTPAADVTSLSPPSPVAPPRTAPKPPPPIGKNPPRRKPPKLIQ
jgi:hypothetical protein